MLIHFIYNRRQSNIVLSKIFKQFFFHYYRKRFEIDRIRIYVDERVDESNKVLIRD